MRRIVGIAGATGFTVLLLVLCGWASGSELYFSSDGSGQDRVTNVQEGSLVWMAVYDPDENVDSGVPDKFWTDAMVFDPRTGACLNWAFTPAAAGGGDAGHGQYQSGHSPGQDLPAGIVFFEETGPSTGLFVSSQPMQIGTRIDAKISRLSTHWVGPDFAGASGVSGFRGPHASNLNTSYGQWDYVDGMRQARSGAITGITLPAGTIAGHGRFENMDTLVGLVVDEDDPTDVALGMMKIVDAKSTLSWDREVYADARGSATITVVDADENIDPSAAEYVPVFILVNPGSWNPLDAARRSANGFSMLLRFGGVHDTGVVAEVGPGPIDWTSIYDSGTPALSLGTQPTPEGTYYIQYPKTGTHTNVSYFDTVSSTGVTRVMFYARETGEDTGVFELALSPITQDLGFRSLQPGDVLVAHYLDPNDFDDLAMAPAYIKTREYVSTAGFVDAEREEKALYWIGRDPVYMKVVDEDANTCHDCPEQLGVEVFDAQDGLDAEWLILDEISSNSAVFFSSMGYRLLPAWDAMGNGTAPERTGGYQVALDNWRLEVSNEDTLVLQYADMSYLQTGIHGLEGLYNSDPATAFPPAIEQVRVANDVSFDLAQVGDTQVFDGTTTTMYFLDRAGNAVTTPYTNSDCVFIKVIDDDQNEDVGRRERIDAYWDGGQNMPFGPVATEPFVCNGEYDLPRCVNQLLGTVNIFNDNPRESLPHDATTITEGISPTGVAGVLSGPAGWAKVYVLNPRSGRWAATDLLETGISSGEFVSVICIDLVSVYGGCVPTLDVIPGDTILAVYTDPSNPSDTAWIAIKAGLGL